MRCFPLLLAGCLFACDSAGRKGSTTLTGRDASLRLDSGQATFDSGARDVSVPSRSDFGPNDFPDVGTVDPFRDVGEFDAGGATEDSDALCSDGVSNDGDRFIDCDDYDCSRNTSVTVCASVGQEDTDALCSDGISNDGDTYVDCDDFDCSRSPNVVVCSSGDCTTCTNDATAGPCVSEFTACGQSTQCQGLLICVSECTDTACHEACRTEYASAVSAYDALMACVDGVCSSVCN